MSGAKSNGDGLPKKVISFRFSDKSAQAHVFKKTTWEEVLSPTDLYIAFHEHKISYFNDAFVAENGFCLMQPMDVLRKNIEKAKQIACYEVPEADDLWGLVIYQLIQKLKKGATKLNVDVKGVVFSLPDLLDSSLRFAITNAIKASEERDEINVRIINNSIAASAAYLRPVLLGIGIEPLGPSKTYCIIDYGLNFTECYVILTANGRSICLAKGRIESGVNTVVQLLRKEVNKENHCIRFDEWKSKHRAHYKYLTETFLHYCNENLVDATFKTFDDENVTISKEEMKTIMGGDTEQITEMVMETIATAKKLTEGIEININNGLLKENNKGIEVEGFYMNAEVKNQFLIERLTKKLHFFETNYGSSFISVGCCYCSRMLSNELIGKQPDQEGEETHIEEVVITELIQPNRFIIEEVEGVEKVCARFPPKVHEGFGFIDIPETLEEGVYRIFDTQISRGPNPEVGTFTVLEGGKYMAYLRNYLGFTSPPEIEVGPRYPRLGERNQVQGIEAFPNNCLIKGVKKLIEGKGVNNIIYEVEIEIEIVKVWSEINIWDGRFEFERLEEINKTYEDFISARATINKEMNIFAKKYSLDKQGLNKRIKYAESMSERNVEKFYKSWKAIKAEYGQK